MGQYVHPGRKLIEEGPASLTDAELLTILISTGIAGKPATKIAEEVLGMFGSLDGICNRPLERFLKIKGLSDLKIARIPASLVEEGVLRGALSFLEEEDQEQPGEEAADVSEPPDASSARRAEGELSQNNLDDDPVAQVDEGGQLNEPEKVEGDYCQDSCMRVKEHVSAHDAGDGAAGANHRDERLATHGHLSKRADSPAHDVEQEKLSVPGGILDVVPKDPKKKHVSEDVPEAAVEKHARQKRQHLRTLMGPLDSVKLEHQALPLLKFPHSLEEAAAFRRLAHEI